MLLNRFSSGFHAQNPLDTYRRGSCQLVADLLATRRTILICQDNRQQVVVMELGERHDITDTTLSLLHTCGWIAK